MRILYLPMYSNLNIGGCSVYNSSKVLFRGLVEQNEDLIVYFPYPSNPEFDISALDYIEHPRIIKIPTHAMRHQSDGIFYTPLELIEKFKTTSGEYLCDVIVCDSLRVATWFDVTLNDHMKCSGARVPVVCFPQFVATNVPHFREASDEFEYLQAVGAYSSWTIWPCKTMYKQLMKANRRLFSPSFIKRIADRSEFQGTMLDCARIDANLKEKPKNQIRVNYGSRLSTQYELASVLEEIDGLYRSGREVRLVVTTPSVSSGKGAKSLLREIEENELAYEIHYKCPQDRFYQIASACHISLWMVTYGELSFAIREQVRMRVAIVAPKTPIYEEMLPDYPFLYRDKSELRAALRFLADEYWGDYVQEVLSKYRQLMFDEYDVLSGQKKFLGFVRNVVDGSLKSKATARMVKCSASMMDDVFADNGGWPAKINYGDLRAFIKAHSRTKKDIEITFSRDGRMAYHWAMLKAGYRDVGIEFPEYELVGSLQRFWE